MNNDNRLNLILAITLSLAIILGWHFFYERPRLIKISSTQTVDYNKHSNTYQPLLHNTGFKDKADIINYSTRVKIITNKLHGSISLRGLRFDDLVLTDYKQDVLENSPNVELLSPSETAAAYFAEVGWYGAKDTDSDLPNSDTVWQADKYVLHANDIVTLTWINKHNVQFIVSISVDDNYMFTINQSVINNSKQQITVQLHGLVHRNLVENDKSVNILHQGPIASIDSYLNEVSYSKLKNKKHINYNLNVVNWLGISDKYWLTSFIPDTKYRYSTSFIHGKAELDKYQVSFLSPKEVINSNGGSLSVIHHLFLGAKEVKLLDHYAEKYNIKLFDRAIDFGWFYILTKPLFYTLSFFYKYCGNFGVSILIVTVLVKIIMFSLANRSYSSMKKMKDLQPKIQYLQELYGKDKIKFQQEVMALYKKEKINPVAGCLPVLMQLPVFFSLYKVLYVTIEMRHAPFFIWIKDLSDIDPTCIFNLFGLLPFHVPSFLNIGAWPIFTAITMVLQQKMNPAPTDPVQAQVLKFMPLVFLVVFSSFPAGLLIYWTWNNILSMLQQLVINKLNNK
ncbi:membrane protein insertase, YidC/Oxa1 family domain protein [Orientia chuto str. Dubai]|uniref:Membrane protein insertase YidC n=1 Tax=Orientia chuto str. Dubai TaxID=1359168 RepID=A0A0F3MM19_9RICK|nr:membrane protein insertase YidC [Candidatus Orientia mediorientalis]KJV56522.1 membrane protein insertase, YidC/Oxa1 family domain protein [Orientia chuto str. Dubai]